MTAKILAIRRTFAFEERVMFNPQVSLLKLTLETDIPGDVMWSLRRQAYCVCAAS